jgi:LysR family transcriptional activator of nhaA
VSALNYHHLRHFHAIAQEGGLTAAARRLNIAPSALSTQLRQLEDSLGHPLFERRGRRLELTEAGRIALDHAETIFAAGAELLDTLRGARPQGRRLLRIGAIPTLSRNFQLELLRPLIGRRDVELVLRSGEPRELLAGLEALALDLVLSNAPGPGEPFVSRLLDKQPVSLVARPGGPAFRYPDSLREVAVLLPGPASAIRQGFDRLMREAGIAPTILAEVDDMAMLRLLARESPGVALVPPVVVRDELKSGLLVERCRVPGLVEDFHAITRARRFPNPLLAELLGPA